MLGESSRGPDCNCLFALASLSWAGGLPVCCSRELGTRPTALGRGVPASPRSSISWRLTGPLARHLARPTSKMTSRTWARWKSQRRSFSSQEGWVPASLRPALPRAPEIESAEYRRVDRAEYRDYVLTEYRLVHRRGANSRTHRYSRRYSARLRYSFRSRDPPIASRDLSVISWAQ